MLKGFSDLHKQINRLLDVPSIKADISSQEIVDIVREGRER